MITDPLKYLYKVYGYKSTLVKRILSGNIYTTVILKNGNIGVCSNDAKLGTKESKNFKPDLKNYKHRVLLNAYYNALFNYSFPTVPGDISKRIEFGNYKNIVMVGYFRPLYKKLKEKGIVPVVFDLKCSEPEVTSLNRQEEFLNQAHCVIISSTSLANDTFTGVMEKIQPDCHAYLLGPSSILVPELKNYSNIKAIFGCHFQADDKQLIELILHNGGARDFLKLAEKVML